MPNSAAMAFMADKVSSARNRQKQALISEAGKAGARVVDVVEFGSLDDAAGAVAKSSLTAMVGGRMQVDGVMVLRLETHGWAHAFAQPFAGFQPLPGEHHGVMQGGLAAPAILRESLRRSDHPWDPAAGPEVADYLKRAPALRRAVDSIAWEWAAGLTKITLDWAVQLRSCGDGSTHVVMQSGRYGGLTTYEVGFGPWLQICGAIHSCLSAWAPPAQSFAVPVRYAEAVGFAAHPSAPHGAGASPESTADPNPDAIRVAIDYHDAVRGALTVHAGKRVWIGSDAIPPKQLGRLRELVLGPQLAHSPILAAIDLTLFGSAKDALVVTPTQLLTKEFDDRQQIDLAAIRSVPPGQSTVASSASIVVDRLGTISIPTGTHVEPVLALLEAIAQANARASVGAGVVEAQVSAFVGEALGQVSMDEAQALAARAQAQMQTGSIDDKINAAARLLVGGQYQAAIDAYLAIAQAHPEHTGTCYSQVGAGLFFLQLYGPAIEYYAAAKQYGADPRMMDENIAEARGYL
jgi:hypothetical protein